MKKNENTAGSMDWCDVEIQTIRSKWECIETPMKLNDRKIFEQWIKEQ